MKCFIGIGSNLGDRLKNLESAALRLNLESKNHFRVSPVYTTAALVPKGAPDAWRIPFFNAVIEMDWQKSPDELLKFLKALELELGRSPHEPKWSPRLIDLDILVFGDSSIQTDTLKIPHPEISKRSFVLDPLKDLAPHLKIDNSLETVLRKTRALSQRNPAWMAILNLTPDSFSDGGENLYADSLLQRIERFEVQGIQFLDLGAESTRPGAISISAAEEWSRLQPVLEMFKHRYRGKLIRPKLSVDTRHAETAARASDYKIDCINDVSGASDPKMMEVVASMKCDYVLMHSLSVPADPKITLDSDVDLVQELKRWCRKKFEDLDKRGVTLDRVIFDPGVGFGKTAQQSLTIIRRIEDLLDLPCRVLVGHSRKSFLKTFSEHEAVDRDPESIGISLQLAGRGVDILRVHEADLHSRALLAFQETSR